MIMDAELVRKIVALYGEEQVYPSKIQFEHLCEKFSERHPDELIFVLKGCVDAGIIEAVITQSGTITKGASPYIVLSITGLYPYNGSEFYINSKNEKRWRKALDKCLEDGSRIVSLARLLNFLINLD